MGGGRLPGIGKFKGDYLDLRTLRDSPGRPPAGFTRLWVKGADGDYYQTEADGTETALAGGGGGGAPTSAEYVTTATDGTLSAEVVIPGLAASPDRVPSGVTSLDFDSSTSGLTAIGSPTTFASDTSKPSQLFEVCTTASALEAGYAAWTPGAAGHAAWCKIIAHNLPGSFARAGVFVAAATPGAASGLFIRRNASLLDFEWRDYNASTVPQNNASQAITDVPYTTSVQQAYGPIWLMVEWQSNTSLTFRFSLDGIVFRSLAGTFVAHSPTTAFTTGSAGVGMEGEGTAGRAWFDYLRFGDPAAAGLYLA
jgi:hypothetical protein